MPKPLPSAELLRKLLRYEPDTGKLYWRERDASLFAGGGQNPSRRAVGWNKAHAGKEAFTALSHNYRCGRLFNKGFLSHRVIWKIVFGTEPDEIDHINGVTTDNRISNLRSCCRVENSRNTSIRSDSSSGVVGVTWDKVNKKWRAKIDVNQRTICLGRYKTKKDAILARKMAEQEHGFHRNHGRKKLPI